MSRAERGLVVLAIVVIALFATAITTGVADWLGGQSWFGNGSNLIQWISGPGTLIAVATALWMRWTRSCAVPYCLRFGEHPVAGTTRKVCHNHHTLEHHRLVHDLHGEVHRLEGRLGWGESHGRT